MTETPFTFNGVTAPFMFNGLTPYTDPYGRVWLVAPHHGKNFLKGVHNPHALFLDPTDINWPGPFQSTAHAQQFAVAYRLTHTQAGT